MSNTPIPFEPHNNSDSTETGIAQSPAASPRIHSGWRTFATVTLTVVVTLAIGYWLYTSILFPTAFTPVELSQKEQLRLDQKLERLGLGATSKRGSREALTPEPYSEAGAKREITITEKELNALLANNTDLANQLVIDLSDDLASVKLLIDMDPDFPIFGGKTLKVTAGMELNLNPKTPRAVLKGVSIWGVPLPDAWLGNLKNIDLLQEYGGQGGFWQTLNAGVDEMRLQEGQLRIRLKE